MKPRFNSPNFLIFAKLWDINILGLTPESWILPSNTIRDRNRIPDCVTGSLGFLDRKVTFLGKLSPHRNFYRGVLGKLRGTGYYPGHNYPVSGVIFSGVIFYPVIFTQDSWVNFFSRHDSWVKFYPGHYGVNLFRNPGCYPVNWVITQYREKNTTTSLGYTATP